MTSRRRKTRKLGRQLVREGEARHFAQSVEEAARRLDAEAVGGTEPVDDAAVRLGRALNGGQGDEVREAGR